MAMKCASVGGEPPTTEVPQEGQGACEHAKSLQVVSNSLRPYGQQPQ